MLQGVEAKWIEGPGSGEEEELAKEEEQNALQPGNRASSVMRKRVEREELSGGA